MTPQQAADEALKAISPTTRVSTDGTATVAGRSAYELVLSPKNAATLVDSVHIAIDGATHVPLRVQVFAGRAKTGDRGGLHLLRPDHAARLGLRVQPAPGHQGDRASAPRPRQAAGPGKCPPTPKAKADRAEPKVVGSGWSTVVVTKVPAGDRWRTSYHALGAAQGQRQPGAPAACCAAPCSRPCSPTTAGWPWVRCPPTRCTPALGRLMTRAAPSRPTS